MNSVKTKSNFPDNFSSLLENENKLKSSDSNLQLPVFHCSKNLNLYPSKMVLKFVVPCKKESMIVLFVSWYPTILSLIPADNNMIPSQPGEHTRQYHLICPITLLDSHYAADILLG